MTQNLRKWYHCSDQWYNLILVSLSYVTIHHHWLSPVVGKLNFALQVKIGYNSLWLPVVLDKLWKFIITSLLDMLQSWLNCHFLGLDVSISNSLQPQNTPWATKGLIGGGGPHIYRHENVEDFSGIPENLASGNIHV